MTEFNKIFALLRTATKELKYPTIRFTAETGEKVSLFYAFKGYIGIKVNGEYVGKIMPEPTMSFRMYQGSTELQKEVMEFCKNPLENAIIKGQKYSNCVFCGLELTNKASLQMGYGPICAGKWNLPWHYTEESLINLDAPKPVDTATPGIERKRWQSSRPNDFKMSELEAAIKFYEESPDGQYDEIAAVCIRQALNEYNQHN